MAQQQERNEQENRYAAARAHGRHVIVGDEAQKRIIRIKDTLLQMQTPLTETTPAATLRKAMGRFEVLCQLIQEIGEPFLRSGSKDKHAQLICAWYDIVGWVKKQAQLCINAVDPDSPNQTKKKTTQENNSTEQFETGWVLVNQFINSLLNPEVISRANTLLALCWTEEDLNIRNVFEFIVPVSTQGYRGEGLDRKDEPSQEY